MIMEYAEEDKGRDGKVIAWVSLEEFKRGIFDNGLCYFYIKICEFAFAKFYVIPLVGDVANVGCSIYYIKDGIWIYKEWIYFLEECFGLDIRPNKMGSNLELKDSFYYGKFKKKKIYLCDLGHFYAHKV